MSAAACEHVKSLRGSLTSITHVSFSASSTTVITADVKNIKTQLAELKSEPEFANQAKALNASVSQVEAAAKNLTTNPAGVIKALRNLKTTATPMIGQLKTACP